MTQRVLRAAVSSPHVSRPRVPLHFASAIPEEWPTPARRRGRPFVPFHPSRAQPGSSKAINPNIWMEFAVNGRTLPGRVVFDLTYSATPITAKNFQSLSSGIFGYGYSGSTISKVVPNNFIQGGLVTGKAANNPSVPLSPTVDAASATTLSPGTFDTPFFGSILDKYHALAINNNSSDESSSSSSSSNNPSYDSIPGSRAARALIVDEMGIAPPTPPEKSKDDERAQNTLASVLDGGSSGTLTKRGRGRPKSQREGNDLSPIDPNIDESWPLDVPGLSIYGRPLPDEPPELSFAEQGGLLAMANGGRSRTAASVWFVTLTPRPDLDGYAVPFGKVIAGLSLLERLSTSNRVGLSPTDLITISACGEV